MNRTKNAKPKNDLILTDGDQSESQRPLLFAPASNNPNFSPSDHVGVWADLEIG
jgi:hypothetical protein